MATFTISSCADTFPVGTSVSAYLSRYRINGSSPSGSATATASVASNGSLAFTGLADDTEYVAYAAVGGVHKYRSFQTSRPRYTGQEIVGPLSDGDAPVWSDSDDALVATPVASGTEVASAATGDTVQKLATGGWGARRGIIVAKPEEDDIHACAARAIARGGGTVFIPAGYDENGDWAKITLTEPLPVADSLTYLCVEPGTSWGDDLNWTETGTVFEGDGTFRAFEHNATDHLSDPYVFDDTGVQGFSFLNAGFENFLEGFKLGGHNIVGAQRGRLDKLYFRHCGKLDSDHWAFQVYNWFFIDIGDLYCGKCPKMGRFRHSMTYSAMGNSVIKQLFGLVDSSLTADQRRFARGYEFEAMGSADETVPDDMGGPSIDRLQVNRLDTTKLSITGTFTNGSDWIAVPDRTQWERGMLLTPTTTNYGLTATVAYYVQTVDPALNRIKVGLSSFSTPITASGSGTLTLESRGHPNIVFRAKAGAAHIYTPSIKDIDSEGNPSAGLYVEGVSGANFNYGIPSGQAQWGLVGREFAFSHVTSPAGCYMDLDGASSTLSFTGVAITPHPQFPPRGLYRTVSTAGVVGPTKIGLGGGLAGGPGDVQSIETRAQGMLATPLGVAQTYRSVSSSPTTLDVSRIGRISSANAGALTCNLATITDDTTLTSSKLGLWFDVHNIGIANVTINTDGTQLFNKVTGLTQIVLTPMTAAFLIAMKAADGTLYWHVETRRLAGGTTPAASEIQTFATNGNRTLVLPGGVDHFTALWTAAITADRTFTLQASGRPGARARVVRTAAATGAFNIDVGPGIKTLSAAGQWADFIYDGSAWSQIGYGTL